MNITSQSKVKPISYMKANAARLREELGFEPMFVTQNGEETLVVQTAEAFHLMQEQLAFMQLVIDSENSIKAGNVMTLDEMLSDL
ncbi:prevent-host-death protein [Shewanella vesiculosa]|jgi:PHD/YefM family antitoxin component YafN of YafNO toxin-antitoxin module|uniref:type II toxin-antitoxin system Phd/YefM family antitoxin n=1 Tax=Shewanella vesiculosa TaxID=518738 RepID=UPI000F4F28DE|nr:type II toxin-antitoxin system Phd/YefM family antitoxin [Shewanella vesiculosa]RPA50640.1 prevent-host-death protein [Shewanella vesiculosa]UJL44361.1 prevent-host-death protein [Shewanella vesiculosa]